MTASSSSAHQPTAYTYAQRHERAADTFRAFLPDVDPDRVAGSLERRLGALGSFAFDVVGEMWARPELPRRDRSIIVVSTLAAQARDEELELHTQIGVRNGLTRVELEEIVVTVAVYAGFPAAMAAIRRVDAGLRAAEGVEQLSDRQPAAKVSDEERDRAAAQTFRMVTGEESAGDPGAHLQALVDRLGGVGEEIFRWAFGDVWSRTELAHRDRSLSVIAILTSLGAPDELSAHVRIGTRNGLSRQEIEAAITHLSLYAGVPRAVQAMRTARETFAKLDG
jgi:4-carboxymuconolactone decarboxylase